jgi:hypothetical protein
VVKDHVAGFEPVVIGPVTFKNRGRVRTRSHEPHGLADARGEALFGVGLIGGDMLSVWKGDPNGRKRIQIMRRREERGAKVEHVSPFARVLGAHDLARLAVDLGEGPIADEATLRDLGCVKLFAQHRLDGVTPDPHDRTPNIRLYRGHGKILPNQE